MAISTLLSCSMLGCISTTHFKNNVPYYKPKTENRGGVNPQGYYLSTITFENGKKTYYQPFFFDEKGLILSYEIKDSLFSNFEKQLNSEIVRQETEKISSWGAYIVEIDTLRMQTVSFNSKYNLFVKIPVLEHVFSKNNNQLIYEYSFDIDRKSEHFRINDFQLKFEHFAIEPNIEELID